MERVLVKAVVIPLLFFVSLPGGVTQKSLSGRVRIDGSSTVFPLTEAVAEEFRRRYPRVRVTVGVSGTGGGFKRFSRGAIDICEASRPIKAIEIKACRKNKIAFIELPIAYDAIAVVVNPRNTWCNYLTLSELKRIWEPRAKGRIVRWSQVRRGFPNRPLRLLGPGTASGTFDFFTEAVVGRPGASRSDYSASEDDNILVMGVARDINALAYFGLAYYAQNRRALKLVAIRCPCHNKGKPVRPSIKAVLENRYHLARPLFIYINRKSAERPEVKAFVEFYLKHSAALAKEVGYIPLAKGMAQWALRRFRRRITGSVFEGKGVGVVLRELLKGEKRGK